MDFNKNISETEISILQEQNYCKGLIQNNVSYRRNNIINKKKIIKKHKKTPFTLAEDQLLLLQIVRFGKRFEAIARNFPRRSKHELKNRYYNDLRGKENEIFQPKSCFFIPDNKTLKQNTLDVSFPAICVSLDDCLQVSEGKEILKNLVLNMSNIFTQLKQMKF